MAMFFSPAAAMMYAQNRQQNGGQAQVDGVGDLLKEFSSAFEVADIKLLLYAIVTALSFSFALVSTILICLMPPPFDTGPWYYCLGGSSLVFVVSLVLLIEPRPSEWLPSLEQFSGSLSRCSITEWKVRFRRWYRWRSKYAAGVSTKLNV